MNFFRQTNTKYRIKKGGCDVMTMFIECIYEFFNNPKNLAEFEKWKKERKRNDEIDLDIEGCSLSDGNRNNRFYRN